MAALGGESGDGKWGSGLLWVVCFDFPTFRLVQTLLGQELTGSSLRAHFGAPPVFVGSFPGTRLCPLIHVSSVTRFVLQHRSRAVETEIDKGNGIYYWAFRR